MEEFFKPNVVAHVVEAWIHSEEREIEEAVLPREEQLLEAFVAVLHGEVQDGPLPRRNESRPFELRQLCQASHRVLVPASHRLRATE